jgi:hypothetical protein
MYSLTFDALPSCWAIHEAETTPAPWLANNPLLHALRRMAIMADVAAVRLLLSLEGYDAAKEAQIRELAGKDKVADRAHDAVQCALEVLKDRPVPEARVADFRFDEPDSDYSEASEP